MLHSPGGAAPDVATIQMRIAEMEQELARGPNQEHALVVPNPRHAAQLQERIAWARQVAQTPPISPEEARAARLTRDATRAAEAVPPAPASVRLPSPHQATCPSHMT